MDDLVKSARSALIALYEPLLSGSTGLQGTAAWYPGPTLLAAEEVTLA